MEVKVKHLIRRSVETAMRFAELGENTKQHEDMAVENIYSDCMAAFKLNAGAEVAKAADKEPVPAPLIIKTDGKHAISYKDGDLVNMLPPVPYNIWEETAKIYTVDGVPHKDGKPLELSSKDNLAPSHEVDNDLIKRANKFLNAIDFMSPIEVDHAEDKQSGYAIVRDLRDELIEASDEIGQLKADAEYWKVCAQNGGSLSAKVEIDKLREELIEAISLHQGWEESAVALVDKAVMPVIIKQENK